MATLRQIEANRRNSQQSTGPRTAEGNSVTRFNALKTGITAKSQVIPGEDPAELEALAAGYHQQFQPSTSLECFLVDTLVQSDWQLRRLRRVEAHLWTAQMSGIEGDAPLGEAYTRALDPFTRLQRRIDATERSFFRALTQLQRMQLDAEPDEFALDTAPDIGRPSSELASFFPMSESPALTGVSLSPPGVK